MAGLCKSRPAGTSHACVWTPEPPRKRCSVPHSPQALGHGSGSIARTWSVRYCLIYPSTATAETAATARSVDDAKPCACSARSPITANVTTQTHKLAIVRNITPSPLNKPDRREGRALRCAPLPSFAVQAPGQRADSKTLMKVCPPGRLRRGEMALARCRGTCNAALSFLGQHLFRRICAGRVDRANEGDDLPKLIRALDGRTHRRHRCVHASIAQALVSHLFQIHGAQRYESEQHVIGVAPEPNALSQSRADTAAARAAMTLVAPW